MKDIVVASNNSHKIEEIRDILKEFNVKILSLRDMNIDIDVEENGETFEENSYIKAKAIYDILKDKEKYYVLSDDSGLSVDALGGRPGIYSARYAGEHGNDILNNKKLIKEMEGVKKEDRSASFICVITLVTGEASHVTSRGEAKGYIVENLEIIDGAFGYDPLFYYPEFKNTFAKISKEEKNSISHRKRALEDLKEKLKLMK